jgi:hypothetical protein
MGFVSVTGPCWSCGRIFTFSPTKVPSHRDENGVRQPVCAMCMEQVNAKRVEMGLPPHPVRAGAYEPDEEV